MANAHIYSPQDLAKSLKPRRLQLSAELLGTLEADGPCVASASRSDSLIQSPRIRSVYVWASQMRRFKV